MDGQMTVEMAYEQIVGGKNTLADRKAEFDNLIKQLDEINSDLSAHWKGYAQETFAENYKEVRSVLDSFSKLLELYCSETMIAVSEAAETDQKSARRIDDNLYMKDINSKFKK